MDLNTKERFYYDLFLKYCEKYKKDSASSMEIKLEHDLSNDSYNSLYTTVITKFLTKIADKGFLVKKKTGYLVYFQLPKKNLTHES